MNGLISRPTTWQCCWSMKTSATPFRAPSVIKKAYNCLAVQPVSQNLLDVSHACCKRMRQCHFIALHCGTLSLAAIVIHLLGILVWSLNSNTLLTILFACLQALPVI